MQAMALWAQTAATMRRVVAEDPERQAALAAAGLLEHVITHASHAALVVHELAARRSKVCAPRERERQAQTHVWVFVCAHIVPSLSVSTGEWMMFADHRVGGWVCACMCGCVRAGGTLGHGVAAGCIE
jgi:hypothetical protein